MAKIEFDQVAIDDLTAIRSYYGDISSRTQAYVMADIDSTIKMLVAHPELGMWLSKAECRRIISAKYGYRIHYLFENNIVTIFSVVRYQNRIR